jgi:hypothetical protein
MKEYEIFTRNNRVSGVRASQGLISAKSKKEAIQKYCSRNHNVWVSAKEVK